MYQQRSGIWRSLGSSYTIVVNRTKTYKMNITSVVLTAATSGDSSSVSLSGVGEWNHTATTLASTYYSTSSTSLRPTSSPVVFDSSRGSSSGIATFPPSTDTKHDFSTAHSVFSASATAMDGNTGPSGVPGDQTSHVLSATPSLSSNTPSSSTSVLTMSTGTTLDCMTYTVCVSECVFIIVSVLCGNSQVPTSLHL